MDISKPGLPTSEKIRRICQDLTLSLRRYEGHPSGRVCGADLKKSAEGHLTFLCKHSIRVASEKISDDEEMICREIINEASHRFDEMINQPSQRVYTKAS